MSNWQTFLQNFFPLAEEIREKRFAGKYRAAVLIFTALAFSVLDVTPAGFVGNERQALAAYRQASIRSEEPPAVGQLVGLAGSEEREWFTIKKAEPVFAAARQQIGHMLKLEKEKKAEAEKKTNAVKKTEAEKDADVDKKANLDSYDDRDYQALLSIVQAEAGGCDDTGKILVANVVLNRVKSDRFPDSIADVVYQKSQFSPVADGSIHRAEVSESTKACVNRALGGEDYSRGALFFMNRGASQPGNVSWFDRELTFVLQHGAHEFFK
ncbi:MAG: cell wall hydrolase [Lachnospiraceae bacterium]|nr:cell wall hydrolase [Lachnospiraceae bacterium]